MKHILIHLFILMNYVCRAQDGTIDVSYGSSGRQLLAVPDVVNYYTYNKVGFIQPDKKIIQAFSLKSAAGIIVSKLIRYKPDGTVDSSFGVNGIASSPQTQSERITAIVVQSDGKIVVTGNRTISGVDFHPLLIRFHSDGRLDSSFGSNGKTAIPYTGLAVPVAIALQQDGKIVIAGEWINPRELILARFKTNGTLDSTFGSNGQISGVKGGAMSLLIQPDGKIVVAGTHTVANFGAGPYPDFNLYFARFLLNGSPDPAFGIGGTSIINLNKQVERVGSIMLQPDNKFAFAGYINDPTIFTPLTGRLLSNGSLDPGYGINGVSILPATTINYFVGFLAVQTDGKMVVSGLQYTTGDTSIFVLRTTTSGSLDNSFGTNGIFALPKPNGTQNSGQAIGTQNNNIILAGQNVDTTTHNLLILTARVNNSTTFFYPVLLSTAIHAFSFKQEFELGPNPAISYVKINMAGSPGIYRVDLLSLSGNQLKTFRKSSSSFIVSLAELPSAIYVLRITNLRTKNVSSTLIVKS